MSFFTYFKKRNKTDGFTVLCVSILFKFEISCLCESFLKFNANLVMFTTISINERILNKYYVHHIFKICIYTGMTATTKFVLCQLGSTYHRFQFYATDWGVFIRRKLCFGCRQSYHIWRVDKTSLVGLVFQFVFLKYRSSSTTDFA